MERADWLRTKSRAQDAVRLIPTYNLRKIVSAKARLKVYFKPETRYADVSLNSVQVASCFKQTNDTPVRHDFTHSVGWAVGLKIPFGSILRSFRREQNFVRRRAV